MSDDTVHTASFDDPVLLERMRRGDRGAWRTAFRLLWSPAALVARAHLRDHEDIDETAARALELLHRRRAELETPCTARALVVSLARRAAVELLRFSPGRRRFPYYSVSLESLRNAALEDLTELQEVAAVSATERVLATLSEEDRVLARVCFLDGKASSEIAAQQGSQPSDARQHILGLLRRLRRSVPIAGRTDGSALVSAVPEGPATPEEFEELWIRLREGVAPLDDVRRFENALAVEPRLRREVGVLETLCSHAALATALSDRVLEARPGVLEAWERRTTQPVRRVWRSTAVQAAAMVGVLVVALLLLDVCWPERSFPHPFAFVWAVPAARLENTKSVALVHAPYPVFTRATLVVPQHAKAWVLRSDGALTTIAGEVSVSLDPPSGSEPDVLFQDGALLSSARARFSILSPADATASRQPDVWWSEGFTGPFTVELHDLQLGVVSLAVVDAPPLRFEHLGRPPLEVGSSYRIRMLKPGGVDVLAEALFDVVDGVIEEPESPGERLMLIVDLLRTRPKRRGDAWLLWAGLPASWKTSELGLRLAGRLQPHVNR